jgi:hypothetical protein
VIADHHALGARDRLVDGAPRRRRRRPWRVRQVSRTRPRGRGHGGDGRRAAGALELAEDGAAGVVGDHELERHPGAAVEPAGAGRRGRDLDLACEHHAAVAQGQDDAPAAPGGQRRGGRHEQRAAIDVAPERRHELGRRCARRDEVDRDL